MVVENVSITDATELDLQQASKSIRVFPLGLLWFVLIPALPFLLSLASISFFIDAQPINISENTHNHQHSQEDAPTSIVNDVTQTVFIASLLHTKIDYLDFTERTLNHISNLLTYLSVTSLHAIICLLVISFFFYKIHQLPSVIIKRAYLFLFITTAAFLLIAYIIHLLANDLILTQLGYKSICILLSKAELPTNLVWADPSGAHSGTACFEKRLTHLVWLAYLPIFLGVLAIILATTFTIAMASQAINKAGAQWREQFLERVKNLQKSFYLMSVVLVSSTITILLFTSLPIDLLKDQVLIEALNKLFVSLTAYWGAIFTTTLFATFLPACLLLIINTTDHYYFYISNTEQKNSFSQWLHESVFVSFKKQITHVFLIISPMLVGPINDLIKSIGGLSV